MRLVWMMPLAMLANSAALADTPPKRGFDASDLKVAAPAADSRAVELARETERLRLAMAYDTALGLSTRTEAERAVLLAALPTGDGAADLRVRWFMAGAIAQPAFGTSTILFNPLARGRLAIDWVRESNGWRITHAWLSSPGPAKWPASSEPWRKAFAEDFALASVWPGDEDAGWVTYESDRWLASLAQALRNPAHRKGIEAGKALIHKGASARAGGGNIDLMPEHHRRAFAAIGAIPRGDGGLAVIYGSPLLPQLLVAADINGGGILEKLSLINLDNAGEVK